MSVFKVGNKELETQALRGRKGRATTGYILKKVSGGRLEDFMDLIEDDAFLTVHLPVILGSKEDAKYVDDNASVAEFLKMINLIAEEVSGGFENPEVSAALKNSPDTQGEDS